MDLVAAARHGDDPAGDRVAAMQRMQAAAVVLARQVQVTRSQEKELSVAHLLAASHQVLVEIRDGLRRVESRVAALEAKVDRVRPGSVAPTDGEEEAKEEAADSNALS